MVFITLGSVFIVLIVAAALNQRRAPAQEDSIIETPADNLELSTLDKGSVPTTAAEENTLFANTSAEIGLSPKDALEDDGDYEDLRTLQSYSSLENTGQNYSACRGSGELRVSSTWDSQCGTFDILPDPHPMFL